MGEKRKAVRCCGKCGYSETRDEEPAETKDGQTYTPLAAKCPKCGADSFFLRNVKMV